MSRSANSMKNLIASTGGEIFVNLLKFVTRSIFISTLGTQYLGISGLFTNLLSVLSLAELGVGSAITFNLYKPIVNKDQHKILLLMKLYKNAYRIIGLVIAGMGILLIPFLPYIIKDNIHFININIIFLIFLMQSVSSYLFFAYKSAIIRAHQKEYIIVIISSLFTIITNLVQILLLIVFKNYEVYILTAVLFTILQNIFIAIKSNRMFPYIKEKTKDILPKKEMLEIFKDCYAIFIYNINSVVVRATDNILLSAFIGLEMVGLYSNYVLIVHTVKQIINKFYSSIKASLGDLHASDDVDREYFIFKVVNFFTICAYGLASIGTFVVGNEFIGAWIGKDFTLPQSFVALIAIEIYIFGLEKNLATFRAAMGLFQQAKYRPVFGMLINLGLSVILIQYIGIYGVVIGTIVSSLLTYMWFDPYIIYKHVFKKSVFEYYASNVKYIATISSAAAISYFISKSLNGHGIFYVLIYSIVCVLVTGSLIFLLYRKTPEFMYIYRFTKKIITKLKKLKVKT